MPFYFHIDPNDTLVSHNGTAAPQGSKLSDLPSLDADFVYRESIDESEQLTGQYELSYEGQYASPNVETPAGVISGQYYDGLAGPNPPHPPRR